MYCAQGLMPMYQEQKRIFTNFGELDLLKQESIDWNKLWKAAGKSRSGSIFIKRQSSRLLGLYRKRLRDEQNAEIYSYFNDLHEALLKKDTVNFWKCWWSTNVHPVNKCTEINSCVDNTIIVNRFAEHFSSYCCCNISIQADSLREEYEQLYGNPFSHLIHNCKYLYLNTDISISIADICN